MKIYRKTTFLIFLMIAGFFVQEATAQLSIDHITEQEDFPKKRKKRGEKDKDYNENRGIFFGGNIGGGYSNGLQINISPTVGYQFTDRFRTAVGFNYYYYNINNNGGLRTNADKIRSFGPFTYAQYLVYDGIYAEAQYQFLDYKQTEIDGFVFNESKSLLLLGGGYSSNRFSKGVGFNVSVLYDVLHDDSDRLYTDPLVFNIGIIYR